MIPVNQSDPRWFQQLLDRAIAEGWCTQMNCTTCGSEDLRARRSAFSTSRRFLRMTPEAAEAFIVGLSVCAPHAEVRYRMEEAARWVLYEVWLNFGDQYFSRLDGTWAGDVLGRMRAHYRSRQEARRIHAARQGVKKRDWPV